MKLSGAVVLFLLLTGIKLSGQVRIGLATSKPTSTLFESSNFQIFESLKDTTKTDTVRQKKHSPKTAAIMSACLPGLGQIYNRKYWKLAIVYPAMGGLGYGIAWNHKYYKYYRDALRIRYDDDVTTIDPLVNYSDDYVVTMKNYYQRYRDLCVIGFAAVYVLQVVDAAVDAHLFYFDVGPDLSMNWQPYYTADANGPTTGISLRLGFR